MKFIIFYIKMEKNNKNKLNKMELNKMNMVQLRALTKENNLRGYSRLRKNDLINLIFGSLNVTIKKDEIKDEIKGEHSKSKKQPSNKELTKSQLKHMSQKASKLSKKSKNLRIDINNLKSQKDDLEEKIKKRVSSTTSAKFKGKKIRSMQREANKLNELIKKQTKELEKIESNPKIQTIFKTSQQSKESERIKKKIEDINRKIRRVKEGNKSKNKAKNRLTTKREAPKLQLSDTTPKLIEGAFGGNYNKYRINGIEGMDLPTFFSKIRSSINNVLRKETSERSIRSQTTTWIRFMKADEYVNLAFNNIMTPVYMLSDIDSMVQSMINHMSQQVDNPALRDSSFSTKYYIQTLAIIGYASINLTGYHPLPRADCRATNVFRQNPRPGDSFSAQNSGPRVGKTKQNPHPRA